MTPEYQALRQAVARAIYEFDHKGMRNVWHWDNAGLDIEHPGVRDAYLRRADAALAAVREALREPSEAMLAAGYAARSDDALTEEIWRAMFAASALGGGDE
jgi:hypothetical protein